MFPDKIYCEPEALGYELGRKLKEKYAALPWVEIGSHNNIPELRGKSNSEFAKMKRHLIIGVRKTHRYTENHKVSDYLVPYTSSGCSAMCLYCYLVCNYNKCSYLRVFVNREQMMDKLIKTANESDRPLTFEIGSNSDLLLENTVTGNLPWTIEHFAKSEKGFLTFPTKFDMTEPLLPLNHRGRIIIRMSVNPVPIIRTVEFGTSPLVARIRAINECCAAGYKVGLLVAPVILTGDYKTQYSSLFDTLAETLSDRVRREAVIEVIFMTYSFVHRAINAEVFPNAVTLYSKEMMTGRGKGRYSYRAQARDEAAEFIKSEIEKKLKMKILYIV